jgi:hypothetical protein
MNFQPAAFEPERFLLEVSDAFRQTALKNEGDQHFPLNSNLTQCHEISRLSFATWRTQIQRAGSLFRSLPQLNSRILFKPLQQPLGRQHFPRQPLFRHRGLIQGFGQCFEDGFHNVMRVTAVQQIHVQIEPAMGDERLKEILKEP